MSILTNRDEESSYFLTSSRGLIELMNDNANTNIRISKMNQQKYVTSILNNLLQTKKKI